MQPISSLTYKEDLSDIKVGKRACKIPYTNAVVVWRVSEPREGFVSLTPEVLAGDIIHTEREIHDIIGKSTEFEEEYQTAVQQVLSRQNDANFIGAHILFTIGVLLKNNLSKRNKSHILNWIQREIKTSHNQQVCQTATVIIKGILEEQSVDNDDKKLYERLEVIDSKLERCQTATVTIKGILEEQSFDNEDNNFHERLDVIEAKLQGMNTKLERLEIIDAKLEAFSNEWKTSLKTENKGTFARWINSTPGKFITGIYNLFFHGINILSAVQTLFQARQKPQSNQDSQQDSQS